MSESMPDKLNLLSTHSSACLQSQTGIMFHTLFQSAHGSGEDGELIEEAKLPPMCPPMKDA